MPEPPESAACPFCNVDPSIVIWENDLAVAFPDGFPVSSGHALVVPRRHVASWFDTTPEERQAIMEAIDAVRGGIQERLSPDGWNIGINDGAAAGQTVMHLHVHLIPRYDGDVPDPRGGIRGVIPDLACYWDE